jgi:hypothetical protein
VADKPKKKPFMVRMPEELHRNLMHLAVDRGEDLATIVVDVMTDWWKQQPEFGRYGVTPDASVPTATKPAKKPPAKRAK